MHTSLMDTSASAPIQSSTACVTASSSIVPAAIIMAAMAITCGAYSSGMLV